MAETIVITGGNGFVGRHLVQELLRTAAYQVIVWDKDVAAVPAPATGTIVDITDPTSYREQLAATKPSWLIHLAAVSSVGESLKDPTRAHDVNVAATKQLLEVLGADSPTTKVLIASSADIYGARQRAGDAPLVELSLDAASPVNPYATSKVAMEAMIEESFNDRVMRVRPFPHIGPGQRPGFVVADFASQIAAIEAGKQEPMIKVGNLEAVRDFTDVRDVVRAYRLLLTHGQLGTVYHVASGTGVRISDLLQQLVAMSRVPVTIQSDPTRLRPLDVPYLVGDATKLRQATGWQPEISFEQTLQDTLDDWRQQVAA